MLDPIPASIGRPTPLRADDVRVGDLGSGSDFTPFLQHVGVPSTDIGSGGPYGVYHSVFDNYAWYTLNADPHFIYLQEMARVFGLEALRMADTDVLPYDYVTYAREISTYLATARKKANEYKLGAVDFTPAETAATHSGQRRPADPGRSDGAAGKPGKGECRSAQCGIGADHRGRPAQPAVVQAHHLRTRRVHGLRGGGHSGGQ